MLRLSKNLISGSTFFSDRSVDFSKSNSYFVRPVIGSEETSPSRRFVISATAKPELYFAIPLQTAKGYLPNDASVGDLDGDGEYEIVLHQVGSGRDNSQSGFTSEPILEAYKLHGAMLYRINLRKNIREGAHHIQFMVFDLDGDASWLLDAFGFWWDGDGGRENFPKFGPLIAIADQIPTRNFETKVFMETPLATLIRMGEMKLFMAHL